MKLGTTSEYRAAFEALNQLKSTGADPGALRAIAGYLILSHDATIPESQFPYRGDSSDPRDRAVVEAYHDAWKVFVEGDD
ncbi:MAG: hypothetical protein O2890_06195 [Cyanobacteria bacterium]|nr:hypothetical protein [Cyanobacteriota bacterium]